MMSSNSSSNTITAARGTLLSIALRLLSFLLSQLTVRFVSASALGIASIPLELLLSSTLFIGREGFRLALTKEIGVDDCDDAAGGKYIKKMKGKKRQQQLINVSWLSVPIGAALSLLALIFHLHKCTTITDQIGNGDSDDNHAQQLDYKLAGILYCLSSFIEAMAEPLVIRCLQQMDVTTKAKAEGVALVIKSISCFGCLCLVTRSRWVINVIAMIIKSYTKKDYDLSRANFAVTCFGISQLVYALVFTTIMYQKAKSSTGGIYWPKKVNNIAIDSPYIKQKDQAKTSNNFFDVKTIHLVCIFTLQGFFKHALTEADKIVLSTLSGAYDQGVYAIAASYGGLAARLLLQPMEENARLLYSRQGALVASQHEGKSTDKDDEKDSKATTNDLLKDIENTYFFLIRVVLYIGLLFAAFATNYTSILLRILAGSRWGTNDEASDALSAFCVYTAFLALNGITEAFVYGVARSGNEIGKIGVAHAVVGGIFAIIAPGLVRRYSAVGLVAANCISMALRSMYSINYARVYFSRNGKKSSLGFLRSMFPHVMAVIAFGLSFAITKMSRVHIYDAQIAMGKNWMVAGGQHIGIGIICVMLTLVLSLWSDNIIRTAITTALKRKRE